MALTLNGVAELLPKAVSGPIFAKAAEDSMVMRLAQRVPTTLTGAAIPVTVGPIEADWVAEGAEKHLSDATATTVVMVPKKVATILKVSEEFARTNPGGLYDMVQEKAAEALARAFDVAALHGKAIVGGGAGPFPTFVGQTTQTVALGTATPAEGGIEGDLIGAQGLTPDFTGYALDQTLRARLANVRDTSGRAMITDTSVIGGVPAVYGTAVHKGDATIAGWGGDWTQTAYGVGMDMTVKMSDQATIQGTSMFSTNQIALLVEASYGFVVVAPSTNFVEFTEPPVIPLASRGAAEGEPVHATSEPGKGKK